MRAQTLHEYYCALVSSSSGKYYIIDRSLPTCSNYDSYTGCEDGKCVSVPTSGSGGGGGGSTTPSNQTCPLCQSPSAWSNCVNNNQTRTNYRCGSATNYQCQSYAETQSCNVSTPNLICSSDSECAGKIACPQVIGNDTLRCINNVCQCGAKLVDKTVLLGILIQMETMKTSFASLNSSAAGLLNYYTAINDTLNSEKWYNVTVLFGDAISRINDIENYVNTVKDAPTEADILAIKQKVGNILSVIDQIIRVILSG